MKSHPQKNTLLKNAQATAASNFFKRVFFSPAHEEFYYFFPTLRYFNFFAIAQCLTRQFSIPNRNRFEDRFVQTFNITHLRTDRRASGNSTYKKLAVQCSADTFVVNQTMVLRIKFCGENCQLLVAANRYASL